MEDDGLDEPAEDIADPQALLEAKRDDDGVRFTIDELRAELRP